jgi:hypothetical protein
METSIQVNQLLPTLQTLPRLDKLHLVQFLISQLTQEENSEMLEPQGKYPVWTPHNAFAAADTLLNMLAEEKQQENKYA